MAPDHADFLVDCLTGLRCDGPGFSTAENMERAACSGVASSLMTRVMERTQGRGAETGFCFVMVMRPL